MLRPVVLPGTGKTTFLSTQVRKDAIEYGIDEVMVTSFTRAAAAEIAGRDLPIPESHVGTLHAMCYRALGKQTIAETKIKEWNEVASSYSKLTRAGGDVDEPYWDQDAVGPGDAMLSESQRLRALMVPIERWPQSVQSFYAAWKQWKDDNEYIDFTDMIERGYNELARAPDSPSVILLDEAQDLSRLELALIRKWGERAKKFIIVGDDDQCQPWDALVMTTKGEKYISELRLKKDILLSWDFAPDNWEKMVTQSKFKVGRRMYRGEMYTFVVEKRKVRCTLEHRLLVRDKRNGILYQEAALIEPDWNKYEMLCVGRGWKPIVECYKQDEWAGYVYSLDVDRYHTYVTDGVVSHNCIFSFKGSTPDAFLDPPLPAEQKRVLSKSYRVPAKVHEFSQKWVQKLSRREPKEYKPRDAEGAVGRRPDITWMNTRMMLPLIEKATKENKTFMILASCGYMLTPTIAMLRENGLTFHNPWRRTRGDWNPLSAGRGVSMAQRLLAYMRPDVKTWGAEARMWTVDDLLEWIPILGVKDTMIRGAKKEIEAIPEMERRDELTVNDLLSWFEEDAVSHMLDCDLRWFYAHVMDSKKHGIEYPLEILQRRGAEALKKTPNITIGTIHSVKGGEASEVLLFPDLSAAGAKEWARSREGRDAIIRQWYVGMTRAKETLILGGQATGMAVQL